MKQYHILNGDALKSQFPKEITGQIIVARECLVDGNVEGDSLEALFHTRAQFLSKTYGSTEQDYYTKVASEFLKIKDIPENSEVHLWFEDDLFCQVNFWFVASLLQQQQKDISIFLIRPKIHTQYGFGGLNTSELLSIYQNRTLLTEFDKITSLWKPYQNKDTTLLIHIAEALKHKYPFILTAIKAHMERLPSSISPGRPTETLIAIMNELQTQKFESVFREFNKREYIYGYGDLQVKRLFDTIINHN